MKTLDDVGLPAHGEHTESFRARGSVWHIVPKPNTWLITEENRLAGMLVRKPDGYEVRTEDDVFDTHLDWRDAARYIVANL